MPGLTKRSKRTELAAQADGEAWRFSFAGERLEVALKGSIAVRVGPHTNIGPMAATSKKSSLPTPPGN
jgi:hypothetical protein